MSKEGLRDLLEIPQVVEIIMKWGLSSNKKINKILNMARINAISVDVVNKIPIRKYGRKKRYQTYKYIILKKRRQCLALGMAMRGVASN